ncbi:hypothetical protein ACFTXJ_14555 [Streptomyces zhihengii]|uniref:hypothetical protein n=1 Tax=Streptomyces zhihengii TaxID=1818004 RepID=UPI0036401F7D
MTAIARIAPTRQVGFTFGSGREFLAPITFSTTGPATIGIVGRDGQPLVTIHVDEQRIEYGPGYTPDAAATAFWDAIRGLIPRPAGPRIDVAGRCPACKGSSLFLGDGGYVACSRIDCPEPDAAHTAIETAAERPK